jgi:hypothetical protein
MSDEDRLVEIRERCEAATPGPWAADGDRVFPVGWPAVATCHWQFGSVGGPAGHPMLKDHPDWGGGLWNARANADFIAAAREDVPYLLTEVERLRADVARLEEERDRLREALDNARVGLTGRYAPDAG